MTGLYPPRSIAYAFLFVFASYTHGMMYLSYAIVWGLAEAVFARSLYSLHHYLLFCTLAADQYTTLSVLMGIIYGLFTIIDLGLFDSIGPWFSRYTASRRHFRSFFLSQLFLSLIPLVIAYCIMLSRWSTISSVYIIIGIAEHTKRHLRLFLNVAGYARLVAITEALSYLSYVSLVWGYFFWHGTHVFDFLFYALVITSIAGVSVLFAALFHLYRSLPTDHSASLPWPSLMSQRASCTLSNLMTIHGLHTIALPILAKCYVTNAALLSCTNAIIAALSTIIYKIVTVAGTINFNSTSLKLRRTSPTSPIFPPHNPPDKAASSGQARSSSPQSSYGLSRRSSDDAKDGNSPISLQRMIIIVATVWAVIIGCTSFICFYLDCSITSYLLISLGLYATHSVQQTTKLALDAQFQSFRYSIIITLSNLFTHALFYAALASHLSLSFAGTLIALTIIVTCSVTYLQAARAHRFGMARSTLISTTISTKQPSLRP